MSRVDRAAWREKKASAIFSSLRGKAKQAAIS